jgi:iron-sulfur cluster assembly protein
MLTLTESAKDAVRDMVSASPAPDGGGLRIAAEPGDGGQASLSLSLVAGPVAGDEVVDEDGTRVFLEPAAASLLDDKVLDARRHEDHLHFTLEEQAGSGGD